MQSQDEMRNIVNTEAFENKADLNARMADVMSKAESLGAVSHTIGHFPPMGHTVVLLGLKYEVAYVDHKRGKVNLKLVEPA